MINYVSFDFWNTLAIPNKDYAAARTEFLHSTFGIEKTEYTKVKSHLDEYAWTNGLAVTPKVALSMLLPYPKFSIVDLNKVYSSLEELFLKHPPIICDEIFEAISILKSNKINSCITSNTNFISGRTINRLLNRYSEFNFIDRIFSDIVGHSKPSFDMFDFTYNLAKKNGDVNSREEVLHIGDSYECDFIGAKSFGFRAELIDNPTDVLTIVKGL